MAIDQGRVLPDSYLLDVPTDFAGYVAENYDERYRGRVTVRDALIHSLNACAVRLLSQVGLTEFHGLLEAGGLSTLDRPSGTYGLPLVLGAGEVRLVDLVNLYATLAQGGLYRPARFVEAADSENDRSGSDPVRLFSPEAARQVTEILTDVRRPDLPEAWDLARDVPGVAWKTGTSYGHRDAWAVGFSARYTIGVWVGNFDGKPRKGISGSEHAGPLLFDLFRALDRRRPGSATPGRRGTGRNRGLRPVARAAGAVLPGTGEDPLPARQSPSSRPAPSTGGCWWTARPASCWPATA